MRLVIKDSDICAWAARHIIKRIKNFTPKAKKTRFVLGIPDAMSSCREVFKILVKAHQAGEISFANVVTFNMDEFKGVAKENKLSMCVVMWREFFRHIDIKPENVHILNSLATDPEQECRKFEAAIQHHGGIDFLFCGVGQDGTIARNEPGSSLTSRTRIKTVTKQTQSTLANRLQLTIDQVPSVCYTMGMATVMDAFEVMVIFQGQLKAHALHRCLENGINHMFPASVLQLHTRCVFLSDGKATSDLASKTVRYFQGIDKVAEDTLGGKDSCDFAKSDSGGSVGGQMEQFHRRMTRRGSFMGMA